MPGVGRAGNKKMKCLDNGKVANPCFLSAASAGRRVQTADNNLWHATHRYTYTHTHLKTHTHSGARTKLPISFSLSRSSIDSLRQCGVFKVRTRTKLQLISDALSSTQGEATHSRRYPLIPQLRSTV